MVTVESGTGETFVGILAVTPIVSGRIAGAAVVEVVLEQVQGQQEYKDWQGRWWNYWQGH